MLNYTQIKLIAYNLSDTIDLDDGTRAACVDALKEIVKKDREKKIGPKLRDKINKKLVVLLKKDCIYSVKIACANALSELKNPASISVLILKLKDRDPKVRRPCASALLNIIKSNDMAKLEAKSKEKIIAGLLRRSHEKEQDPLVRNTCGEALAEIAKTDDNVFQILKEGVLNEKWEYKEACAFVLGMAKDSRAVEQLIAGLMQEIKFDWNDYARISCAEALGKIGDVRAIEALMEQLRWNFDAANYMVEEACVNSLLEISESNDMTKLEAGLKNKLIKRLLNKSHNSWNAEIIKFSNVVILNITGLRSHNHKKIIAERDVYYAMGIGLEATLKTIIEYLDVIKDYCTREQVTEIKSELFAFYRRVTEELNKKKEKMGLNLPASIKLPKNITEVHRIDRCRAILR